MNNTRINKRDRFLNQEISLVKNDIVKIPRSTFMRNQKLLTTFDMGELFPIHTIEVIPGDGFDFSFDSLVRLESPLIRPLMDDIRLDVYAFFIPMRLVWGENWEQFIGNYNPNPDWSTNVNLTVPTIQVPTGGFAVNSLADHLGVPTNRGAGALISHLPFRSYCLVWDEWFRDENLQNTILVDKSNTNVVGVRSNAYTVGNNYMTDAILGGVLCPANKIHDLFTSALPAPQKGVAPLINIGGTVPVKVGPNVPYTNVNNPHPDLVSGNKLAWGSATDGSYVGGGPGAIAFTTDGLPSQSFTTARFGMVSGSNNGDVVPLNLIADLSSASGISVNTLRLFFQTQLILEADARYGSRYTELLRGHYGVKSSDARLQRTEFLGSKSMILNINQTVQTSAAESNSPQSNLSAFSQTFGRGHLFSKSFTEHGYVMVFACTRINRHSYSEGVDKMFSHLDRFDFYFPELAHIGEQPIKNKEIYLTGTASDDEVFGYQEPFYEYRYCPNTVSGMIRPDVESNMSVWSLVDDYSETPTLSATWIKEDKTALDRCLAIPSSETTPQFIGDFFFRNRATRPMPLHSVPGLIDHTGKIILS